MKKFLRQFFVFIIPFSVIGFIYIFFWGVGYYIGEFRNVDIIIQKQRDNHSVLYGTGYNPQTIYYKLENANFYQAEVITLGTSRVMQFKADYFEDKFYNCGGAVGGNFDEYLNFVRNLQYKPETIILGIDEWIFNSEWNCSCTAYPEYVPIELTERNMLVMVTKIIRDFMEGSWRLSEVDNYAMNYGFNGCIRDNGYLWDGSYYEGNIYRSPEYQDDYRFVDTYARIDENRSRFEWGEHIDSETVILLEELLKYCKENDINVIGFAPPFAPSVYNKMINSEHYGYIHEITPACEELFAKYDFEYYSYMDGMALGMDDTYFLDGFHGSEVVYGRIIQDMIAEGSDIGKYVNKEKLNGLIKERYSSFLLQEFIHKD